MTERTLFSGGRNIAMKVPPHQYEATLRFYVEVLGLEEARWLASRKNGPRRFPNVTSYQCPAVTPARGPMSAQPSCISPRAPAAGPARVRCG